MRNKKRGRRSFQIKINLTNRWLYTLIIIGILAIISVGVYALTAGQTPDPGHNIQSIGPPNPCSAGQFLKFDGTNWVCSSLNIQSIGPPSPCSSGQFLKFDGTNWVCSVPAGCPSGTEMVYIYANFNEDVYGGWTEGFVGWDTCNGDSVNQYTCDVSVSISCRDVYTIPNHAYYRTVTCKKAMNVFCREP